MINEYAIIDLETTGNSPQKGDKIIQIAIVIVKDNKISKCFNSFVNPEMEIPPFIEQFTNIDHNLVKDAPTFSEIAPQVASLLENKYFVAHNVNFDLTFLNTVFKSANLRELSNPVIDTVEMARIIYPTIDSYELTELAAELGLSHNRPHQADSDALVTAQLFLKMIAKLSKLPTITLRSLRQQARYLKTDLYNIINKIIIEKNQSYEKLSSDLQIINNLALKKLREKDETKLDEQLITPFPDTEEQKQTIFKKGFHNYNYRPGQFKMIDIVFESLLNSGVNVIEAGTGIGKSLAYLLPAAFVAKQTSNRVIISTQTTLLQQQLLNKDIVILQRMLPFPINVALLKGRNNYLSLNKFSESLQDSEPNYDEALTKMQMLIWLTMTETGDLEELNLSSGGMIFVDKIKSTKSSFSEKNCWGDHNFYERAKQAASKADIIITNHALLIKDLQAKGSVIPPSDYLIVDEAQHFVKVGAQQIGSEINYVTIRFLLGQLDLLMRSLLTTKFKKTFPTINYSQLNFVVTEQLTELSYEIEQFFSTILSYIKKVAPGEQMIKFNKDANGGYELIYAAERVYFETKTIINTIEQFQHDIISNYRNMKGYKFQLNQLDQITEQISDFLMIIDRSFLHSQREQIVILKSDFRQDKQSLTIVNEQLNVNEFFKTNLYDEKRSIVFTSATLTVNNSFNYFINQLGLQKDEVNTYQIASPFEYDSKVKLLIPTDIPEINQVKSDDYVAAITEAIISICDVTEGRVLILFTSHEMLRKTYFLIKESQLLEQYILIAQGISSGSNTRLMRNFQRFEKAALFGTNSFWEGVDIPGEDLSCLIIVRLPFTNPNNPIFAAKANLLEEQHVNPFTNLAIPEAVIRFKQGFGRLIRTETDRGLIVVFDRRIVTKNYGQSFLNSIPTVPSKELPIKQLVTEIKQFLHKKT